MLKVDYAMSFSWVQRNGMEFACINRIKKHHQGLHKPIDSIQHRRKYDSNSKLGRQLQIKVQFWRW